MTLLPLLGVSLALAQAPAPSTPTVAGADLMECYQLAKKQSETLRLREQDIVQLEQQYRQALGSVLPSVTFTYAQKYQEVPHMSGASGSSFFFDNPQPSGVITATQPIFSGFREFAGMRGVKHQAEATRLQLVHAYAALFSDVAQSFYLTLRLETDLENTRSGIALSKSRIQELRERENLGKSRHSELVLVESQEAGLEAQAEFLLGQIAVARDMLGFLTGREMADVTLIDRLERIAEAPAEAASLARAEKRTDVLSQDEALRAQEFYLRAVKGAWSPTLGLTGDYYLKRTAALEPIHWDATFLVTMPIFQGGATLAAQRQSESQLTQARERYSLALRQARSEIHRAWATLRASVAQSVAAERAYLKAEEGYRLQTREYRLGLVNNLDVLQSMNALLDAKRTFDESVVQSKLNLLSLKVSAEEVPQ
ncbi:MAG TPA: TolC family protein [Elusimicrobiota bacterium]|jgi:outer membrane protein|nr:TolC family protein [Elusimicrobiota bacterium]